MIIIDEKKQKLDDLVSEVESLDEETVNENDQEQFNQLKEELSSIIDESNQHYTDDEKENAQKQLDQIAKLEDILEEISQDITDFKETVDSYDKDSVKSSDKDALETLIEQIETTQDDKNLIESQKEKLQE